MKYVAKFSITPSLLQRCNRSAFDKMLPSLIFGLSLLTLVLTGYTWVKRQHPDHFAKLIPTSEIENRHIDENHWRTPVLTFGSLKYAVLGTKSSKNNTKHEALIKNMATGKISIYASGQKLFGGPAILSKVSKNSVAIKYKNRRKTIHFNN